MANAPDTWQGGPADSNQPETSLASDEASHVALVACVDINSQSRTIQSARAPSSPIRARQSATFASRARDVPQMVVIACLTPALGCLLALIDARTCLQHESVTAKDISPGTYRLQREGQRRPEAMRPIYARITQTS